MGVQQRRERERLARRSAILDAARALVRGQGFNGTTTKQIAAQCELSEATLFWYFKSKDEIFLSLLEEGIDFMKQGLEHIAAADHSFDERLVQIWDFFSEIRAEHPEYINIFTHLAQPQSTASISEEVKQDLARRSGDNFRLFVEVLGETMAARDARAVADLIWSTFVGMTVLEDSRKNLGSRTPSGRGDNAGAFSLLLSGISPGSAPQEKKEK